MSEDPPYITTAAALKAFYIELTEVEMPESVIHALMAEAAHCLMGDGQIAVRKDSHV